MLTFIAGLMLGATIYKCTLPDKSIAFQSAPCKGAVTQEVKAEIPQERVEVPQSRIQLPQERVGGRPSRSQPTVGCPCSGSSNCTGPRGGSYCITSGGNKRYRE